MTEPAPETEMSLFLPFHVSADPVAAGCTLTKMPARERRRIIGQNGHFPSVPSQTADAPRGLSRREKRSDQHRAGKQVWQLAGDDTQAGDTPL